MASGFRCCYALLTDVRWRLVDAAEVFVERCVARPELAQEEPPDIQAWNIEGPPSVYRRMNRLETLAEHLRHTQ